MKKKLSIRRSRCSAKFKIQWAKFEAKLFSDMKCFRPLLQRSPLKCFPSPPPSEKQTNKHIGPLSL